MKIINKIGIGIVAILIAGLVSFVVYEAKFVSLANSFFAAIEKKDVDAVRSFLPNNGKGLENTALFKDFVPKGVVFHFKADGLFSQSGLLLSTQDKKLRGTLNPEGVPKPVPVTVLYVSENNVWKVKEIIEDVEKGKPTVAEDQERAKVMGLARQAMADFILSKKAKSMEHFYSTLSDAWKKDTTVKQLDKSFEPILADPTDWSFLNPVEPNITKYVVNKDGVLTIIGVYPSKPKRLIFEQNFVNENNAWKLAGFKLYTADAEPGLKDSPTAAPTAEQTTTPAESKPADSTKKSSTTKKTSTTTNSKNKKQ